MKKTIIILFLFSCLVFQGSEPAYYGNYFPVFMERQEMEKAVLLETPRAINNPGKIYIKEPYIFINEKYKGFHVIDNSDPSNPVNKAFIHIDGCLDISVKGNVLYADNAVDLVAVSMNYDISSIQVTGRVVAALPEPSSPEGFWYTGAFENLRPKNGIIVRWEKNL